MLKKTKWGISPQENTTEMMHIKSTLITRTLKKLISK